MLNPRDRHLLLESLRPPEGYTLSYAVGTSYSLDLMALLTAPLAFTFYDWEDNEGQVTSEPLALLESLRRHANQISLFCHAGAIKLPPPAQRLVAYLERSVIEVLPEQEGAIFHPKIWVMRYEDNTSDVRYRFLCLSRNLTFDRSWDTVLVMDGVLEQRKRAFAQNHPLGDFLAALPNLAVRRVARSIKKEIDRISDEIRRVKFELPNGVDDFQFWPLGLKKRDQWPYLDSRRPMLVMSPFIKTKCLNKLIGEREEVTLISRPDELTKLSSQMLSKFSSIFTLDDAADFVEEQENQITEPGLSGLHAKLVVIDDGWDARVYTGSANATNAAFNGNIEFVTELIGRKKDLGINVLLGKESDNNGSLANLLVPWKIPENISEEHDSLQEALEKQLRTYRSQLAAHPMEVVIESNKDGYSLALVSKNPLPEFHNTVVTVWPGTLRAENARKLNTTSEKLVVFSSISLEAITGFIAFELSISEQGKVVRDSFALNLPIRNVPKDRFENLLASLLKDKNQVIRLIWLLLQADGEFNIGALDIFRHNKGGTSNAHAVNQQPIFEEIIKSTASGTNRVKDVIKLVKDLQRSEDGIKLIPEGLPELCETLEAYLENSHER